MREPIVIVGAGQAGLSAAEALRSDGWDGEIVLLGDEPHPPYQRPPLSKKLLTGETTAERLTLRGDEFFASRNITLRTGCRVLAIDRDNALIAVDSVNRPGEHMLARRLLADGATPTAEQAADTGFDLRSLMRGSGGRA